MFILPIKPKEPNFFVILIEGGSLKITQRNYFSNHLMPLYVLSAIVVYSIDLRKACDDCSRRKTVFFHIYCMVLTKSEQYAFLKLKSSIVVKDENKYYNYSVVYMLYFAFALIN